MRVGRLLLSLVGGVLSLCIRSWCGVLPGGPLAHLVRIYPHFFYRLPIYFCQTPCFLSYLTLGLFVSRPVDPAGQLGSLGDLMDKSIVVKSRSVYGRDVIYPVCDMAKLFCRLANTKTLADSMVSTLKADGWMIRVVSL